MIKITRDSETVTDRDREHPHRDIQMKKTYRQRIEWQNYNETNLILQHLYIYLKTFLYKNLDNALMPGAFNFERESHSKTKQFRLSLQKQKTFQIIYI